jgi:hypothetical protein
VRLKNMLRDEMARITFQQLVEEGNLIEANLKPNVSIPVEQIVPLLPNQPSKGKTKKCLEE